MEGKLPVRKIAAFQLPAGSLDFIAHLPSDGDALPVFLKDRYKSTDFIHFRRIEFDMFRAIDRNQVEMAVHLSREAAELFRIFRGSIDVFDKDIFKGHSSTCGLEIVMGSLHHIFNFEIMAHRKDPVADFIIRCMKGNGQGDWQMLIFRRLMFKSPLSPARRMNRSTSS